MKKLILIGLVAISLSAQAKADSVCENEYCMTGIEWVSAMTLLASSSGVDINSKDKNCLNKIIIDYGKVTKTYTFFHDYFVACIRN